MPGTPLALALDSRCVGPPSSPIESTFVPQLPHGCLSAYGASLATLVVQTVSVSGKACGVRILLRGEGAVAPLCAHFFQWFEPLQTSPTRSRLDLSQGSDGTQAFNSTPTISVLIQFHTPAALVSLCRCDPARLLDPYSLVRVTVLLVRLCSLAAAAAALCMDCMTPLQLHVRRWWTCKYLTSS